MLENQKLNVLEFSKKMLHRGLTRGSGGNISVLDAKSQLVVITGSGIDYESMTIDDMVVVDLSGKIIEGNARPSLELPMHLACYRKRPDIHAVVHTHSLFATTIACMGEPILPVSYLVGFSGDHQVNCTPFYPIGSDDLAENASEALVNKNTILLGNHGLISVGHSLKFAFAVAEEVEFAAELYYRTRLIGGGHMLSPEEIEPMISTAKGYVK